ncbi:MAG: hypothetical protein LBQ79_07155, partial [Deltaproteobacteria bacterium]|nr:hypothetical protein [Deltaproteobacteria bacterium]
MTTTSQRGRPVTFRASSTLDPADTVEFVAEGAVAGSARDVFFTADRGRAVSLYLGEPDPGRRKRLEEVCGPWRGRVFGGDGGDYYRGIMNWPEMSVELGGREGYVSPAYGGKFRFREGSELGGVLKEGYWFASARNMRSVPAEERGRLLGTLNVCLLLSRAVGRLHGEGLLLPGLSSQSCLASPSSGDFCLAGLDALWMEGSGHDCPGILPNPDYLPPEAVPISP